MRAWKTAAAPHLRWIAFASVIAACVSAAVPGCSLRRERPPVVLISIDTCRPDRLGCYGYPRPSTPHLDAFSRDAVLFTHAATPIPMTLPAHCSMMTGLLPPEHGVRDNLGYRLPDSRNTMAEELKRGGYATGAVVGAFVLDSRFHLDQGFDEYDDRMAAGGIASLSERKADEVTRLGLDWLNRHAAGRSPFFLFLHYYDAHYPYEPPEPFATTFRDDPYAGEIANVDAGIGRILDDLKRRGLYDEALIIVVGDHGESLGEHGEKTHEYFVYQSTLHIPLLIKGPRAKEGRRDERPASLVDLLPTVLAACRLPAEKLPGENLLAANPSSASPRALYAESLTATKYGCSPLRAVTSGEWKYIETTRPELYNLSRDPQESENLAAQDSRRTALMAEKLKGMLAGMTARTDAASGDPAKGGGRVTPDEETRQRLQSLGYLAGHTVEENAAGARPDPKDFIAAHESFQDALALVNQRKLDQAASLCRSTLEAHPGMRDLYILLGDIEYENHKPAEAMAEYRRYLEVPGPPPGPGDSAEALMANAARAHYNLGNVLADLGRKDEAMAEYREALRINPDHLDARFNLALTQAAAGDLDGAMAGFTDVLKLKPDWPDAQYNLGRALLARGDRDGALARFSEALRLRPGYAEAEAGMGDLLAGQGRLEEAAGHYQSAIRSRPDWAEPRLPLAHILLRLHRTPEAVDAYRSTVQAFPDWPTALNELAWILATHEDAGIRNGAEAVKLAEAANGRTGFKDPAFLETLAASYAESGRFREAVQAEEKALERTRAAGPANAEKTAAMTARLQQYREEHRTRSRF